MVTKIMSDANHRTTMDADCFLSFEFTLYVELLFFFFFFFFGVKVRKGKEKTHTRGYYRSLNLKLFGNTPKT